MEKVLFVLICMWSTAVSSGNTDMPDFLSSPDGKIKVKVWVNPQGVPFYSVNCDDSLVIEPSVLGLKLSGTDLTQNLKISNKGTIKKYTDNYTLLNDKRAKCNYEANQRIIEFSQNNGLLLG